MTIDKAISHLDTYSSTMGSGQTTQAQHEESKRVAIDIMRKYQKIQEIMDSRALSQKPCDDAISRETALEKMADYVASGYAESVKDFEEYSKIICQLPSVTQKSDNKYRKEAKRWKNKWLKSQKSGKWIETEYHRWRCSVCREKGMSEWDNIHNVRTNFCPNCGCRMDEPQESEE